ncbi:pyruvate kinase [Thalassoporum mexicanum PCC 7367]|uniref:pyruvate kinase n=1 Tax=Thalassoporum mexicanum TaxID=3457544 RepID=UPI00029F93F9|nr:pyruvate kinase [Pseudanabaena sp. PCC 7367]AFY69320.1 pyruvate kinase [Pseudanabaena sp. PCC 7367]
MIFSQPHRTKIVATIGPASSSRAMIKQLIESGMAVARLNFSHGSYEDHANTIATIRQLSQELGKPVTLLQDLQGPKVRVGHLPNGGIPLEEGIEYFLVPIEEFRGEENIIPIDYPHLATEAEPDTQILLDDGLLELRVIEVNHQAVKCEVVKGGMLASRKGVNFPSLNLQLPSMTEKDEQDLQFGVEKGIDWVALSFVRQVQDIRSLKELLTKLGAATTPVIAKIEKPQAIDNIEAIVAECDGIMVARGDLGVEMSPEKVPLLQKKIIRLCNQQGIPVITATQMLQSMIDNPRPTRAEASDVANAIIDGTDAVMLSGESAVGQYPTQAVEIMARIAAQTEENLEFINLPPHERDATHAISEAINTIDKAIDLRCIAAFTTSGYTAALVASERLQVPIIAFTADIRTYYRLNLLWGVIPLLLTGAIDSVEVLSDRIEAALHQCELVQAGDKVLIIGGSPIQCEKGTNFIKIHGIKEDC